jgi:hypothetical protein
MNTNKTGGEFMKIVALLALLLLPMILFSCATAEREHVQSGQFDISFEMNKAHEVGYIDNLTKIKTSEGYTEIEILKDESGLSSSQFDQMLVKLFGLAGAKVENLRIDGKDGKVAPGKTGGYAVFYRPVDGYYAIIECSLPPMDTTFFLNSLQIEQKSYVQSVIVHPGSDSLTDNQTNPEDPIRAAQIEIEKLHHYGYSGISLSQYWNSIGDALREQKNTAAAMDAYEKVLLFDPSNSHASFFRGGLAAMA